MIRKSGNLYKVYSKSGKPMSKSVSKKKAVARLGQIEYFKHHPEGAN